MRPVIVDPHLYKRIADDEGLIAAWDVETLADAAYPGTGRLDQRRRRRFTQDLDRAFSTVKKQLHRS